MISMSFRDQVWRYIKLCDHRVSFFIYITILASTSLMELASIGVMFPVLASIMGGGQEVHSFEGLAVIGDIEPVEIIWIAMALFSLRACALLLGTWYQAKFSQDLIVKLSLIVFSRLVDSPVMYIEAQKTSDLIRKVTGTISQAVNSHIIQIITIFFEFFTLLLIIALVFSLVDLKVFLAATVILAFLLFFSKSISSVLADYGNQKRVFETRKIEYVQDIVGLARSLKNFQISDWYKQFFDAASQRSATASIYQATLSGMPRICLELFIFLGGMLYLLLAVDLDRFTAEMPVLGTAMFALLRLLPLINKINVGWQSYRFSSSFVQELQDCVFGNQFASQVQRSSLSRNAGYQFDKLEVKDLVLKREYQDFRPVNFEVLRGQWLLISGPTGCGKSTLMDALLGFFPVHSGHIRVNGIDLDQALPNFTEVSAFVPQKVYLLNRSLTENVMLDIEADTIQKRRLKRVLSICDLLALTDRSDLMDETTLNNSGLSGGQMQRIGIARALVREPQILFMDESTAGLDALVQQKILTNIKSEYPNLTVIMISHSTRIDHFFDIQLCLE